MLYGGGEHWAAIGSLVETCKLTMNTKLKLRERSKRLMYRSQRQALSLAEPAPVDSNPLGARRHANGCMVDQEIFQRYLLKGKQVSNAIAA